MTTDARTPDPEALLTAAVGREAFRPAFEASYLAIYGVRPQALGDGRYPDREAGLRFEGYCAAMESITRTASPEMPKRLRGLIREYLSGSTFTERNTQMAEIEAEYAKHGVPRP